MHIIVRSAHSWRKIEMDVLRLLIWARLGLISFIKGRSMGLLRKLLDFGVFQLCYADCDNSFCSDFYIKKIHIELYNFECPKNQRMPQRINKN